MFTIEIQDGAHTTERVPAETLADAVNFAEVVAPFHDKVSVVEPRRFKTMDYGVAIAVWFEGRQLDLTGRS